MSVFNSSANGGNGGGGFTLGNGAATAAIGGGGAGGGMAAMAHLDVIAWILFAVMGAFMFAQLAQIGVRRVRRRRAAR